MNLFKQFNAPKAFSAVLLVSAVALTGCTGEDDNAQATASAPAQQSTMDVKQPAPAATEKASLTEAAEKVEAAAAETAAVVEEKATEAAAAVEETTTEVAAATEEKAEAAQAEVEATVAEVTAPAGKEKYASCVGCHGANGEGGIGPALNNQSADEIVAKLEKYKAGEQVGPMTGMMAPIAKPLSTEEMQAIAEYISAK